MANLFGSEVPASPNLADGTGYTLGTRFSATAAGQVVAARWYIPTTANTGNLRFVLYNATGSSILADRTVAAPTTGLGSWQEFAFTTPVTVTVGAQYTIAVLTPNRYVWTQNYTWPKTSGPLTTPNPGGYVSYSSTLAYPNDTFSNVNFFVDVNFQPAAAAAPTVSVWNGSAEIPASVSVWNGSTAVATTLSLAT
ncbi:DUF4082 domain-containing protein [Actinoplanes sp. URMC 104]|uniref:DUF4082 domain-containing protein n=1 Tax=Actinoplanes sp. URMC 104 TaxID=3423409 RepID=UPI003F193A05